MEDGFGIDAATIDHNGKMAIGLFAHCLHDGHGLSGFHALPHLDQILHIVRIHCFQSVVVAHHNHISIGGVMARQAHPLAKYTVAEGLGWNA